MLTRAHNGSPWPRQSRLFDDSEQALCNWTFHRLIDIYAPSSHSLPALSRAQCRSTPTNNCINTTLTGPFYSSSCMPCDGARTLALIGRVLSAWSAWLDLQWQHHMSLSRILSRYSQTCIHCIHGTQCETLHTTPDTQSVAGRNTNHSSLK